METQTREYLKDADGHLSSTRLFCMWTLKFFFFWTVFSSGLLVVFALLFQGSEETLFLLAGYFATISFLCLIAAFAPKQLSKIQEVKKLIGTIRKA